jgi:hypothetical protein
MQYDVIPLETHVWVGSTQISEEPGLGMQPSPGCPRMPGAFFRQYWSEPLKKQPSAPSAHAGMVVQQGWPGSPQASHSDTPPIATQVSPALHDVPRHGCPVAPVPPEEPPPLLPEVEPPPLLPEEVPPPVLPDADPPLLAPSEAASGGGVEVTPPPQPMSGKARRSPQVARPRSRILRR